MRYKCKECGYEIELEEGLPAGSCQECLIHANKESEMECVGE